MSTKPPGGGGGSNNNSSKKSSSGGSSSNSRGGGGGNDISSKKSGSSGGSSGDGGNSSGSPKEPTSGIVVQPVLARTAAIAAALHQLQAREKNDKMVIKGVTEKWRTAVLLAESDKGLYKTMLSLLEQVHNIDERQLWCELFTFIVRSNSESFLTEVTTVRKKKALVFIVEQTKKALDNEAYRLALAAGRAVLNYVNAFFVVVNSDSITHATASKLWSNFMPWVGNRDIMTLWCKAANFILAKEGSWDHVFLVLVNLPYIVIKNSIAVSGDFNNRDLVALISADDIGLLKKVLQSGKDNRIIAAARQLLSAMAFNSAAVRKIVESDNDLTESALVEQQKFGQALKEDTGRGAERSDGGEAEADYVELANVSTDDMQPRLTVDVPADKPTEEDGVAPSQVSPVSSSATPDSPISFASSSALPSPTGSGTATQVPRTSRLPQKFMPKMPLMQSFPAANTRHSVLNSLRLTEYMLYIPDTQQGSQDKSTDGSFRMKYITSDSVLFPLQILSSIESMRWEDSESIASLNFEIVRSCMQSLSNLAYTKQGVRAIVSHSEAIGVIVGAVKFLIRKSQTGQIDPKFVVPGVLALSNICFQLPEYKKVVSSVGGVVAACTTVRVFQLNGSHLNQVMLSISVITFQLDMETDGDDVQSVLECARYHFAVYRMKQRKRVSDAIVAQNTRVTYELLGNILQFILTLKTTWIDQFIDLLGVMSPDSVNRLPNLPTWLRQAPNLFGDSLSEKLFCAVIDKLYGNGSDSDFSHEAIQLTGSQEQLPKENLHVLEMCHAGIEPKQARKFVRQAISMNFMGTRTAVDNSLELLTDFCHHHAIGEFAALNENELHEILNPIAIAALQTASTSSSFKAVGILYAFNLQSIDRCGYWSCVGGKEEFFQQYDQANMQFNKWLLQPSQTSSRWSYDSNRAAVNTNEFSPNDPTAVIELAGLAQVTADPKSFLYHATTVAAAKSIMRKIVLTQNKPNLDFSTSSAFYLNPSLKDAMDWRNLYFPRSGALVVYKKPDVNSDEFADVVRLRDFGRPTVDQNGKADNAAWAQYDDWKAHVSQCRDRDDGDEPDETLQLIIGPQCSFDDQTWEPRIMVEGGVALQWCVRSRDLAKQFDRLLVGLASFRGDGTFQASAMHI